MPPQRSAANLLELEVNWERFGEFINNLFGADC
jgi:hypothetical protein